MNLLPICLQNTHLQLFREFNFSNYFENNEGKRGRSYLFISVMKHDASLADRMRAEITLLHRSTITTTTTKVVFSILQNDAWYLNDKYRLDPSITIVEHQTGRAKENMRENRMLGEHLEVIDNLRTMYFCRSTSSTESSFFSFFWPQCPGIIDNGLLNLLGHHCLLEGFKELC